MIKDQIVLSDAFRAQLRRSVYGIITFIVVYLLLFALSLLLLAGCLWLGVQIMLIGSNWLILVMGLGVMGVGVLVFFFLIKFMFKTHRSDRNEMQEIKAKDHPKLFALIQETAEEVGTPMPKHVYLSPGLGASVFYDSNFWSMFVPVRKNLDIGLGLLQSMTALELKAIIAHEFGHFAQGSMRVGSFVYQLNHVIHNMLYDNDSFDNTLQSLANASWIFALAGNGAIIFIRGVQWILAKVFRWVNLSYMGLSRQMEFQADEVAARTTGTLPFINGLYRLDFMQSAWELMMEEYKFYLEEEVGVQNVYADFGHTLKAYAAYQNIPMVHALPQINDEQWQLQQSNRLVFDQQWASHPTIPDRAKALLNLNLPSVEDPGKPALGLLENPETWQKRYTQHFLLSSERKYEQFLTSEDFQKRLNQRLEDRKWSPVFNGYYDRYFPTQFSLMKLEAEAVVWEDLFTEAWVQKTRSYMMLKEEVDTLRYWDFSGAVFDSFDYKGEKIRWADRTSVIQALELEREALETELRLHNQKIFQYYQRNNPTRNELWDAYEICFALYRASAKMEFILPDINRALRRIQEGTSFADSARYLHDLEKAVSAFKAWGKNVMTFAAVPDYLKDAQHEVLTSFLENEENLVHMGEIDQEHFEALVQSVDICQTLLGELGLHHKKVVLKLQEEWAPAPSLS